MMKILSGNITRDGDMHRKSVRLFAHTSPASDGGVRVGQLDAAKLSEWWLCKIGTDFQLEESEIEELICNFCIWDAR